MAKQNDSSVFQLENGNWGYRFTIMRNGQRKDIRRKQDDNGKPFKTKAKKKSPKKTSSNRKIARPSPK